MVPARTPSWKSQKVTDKKNNLFRWVFLVITALILINLTTKVPRLVKFFTEPFGSLPYGGNENTVLDTTYRTNFLFVSYLSGQIVFDAALVSYEPKDKNIILIDFDLPNNPDIRKKTNSAFRNVGVGEVQKYFSLGLFVPIDRYIAVEKVDFSDEYIKNVKKSLQVPVVFSKIFSIDEVFGPGLKSNMSSKEFLDLIFKLKGSNSKNFVYIKISAKNLPDNDISTLLQNQLIDNRILEEGATVTIRNASAKSGLASVLAAYVTSLGASVVAVENANEPVEKSSVIIKNEKNSLTSRIETVFHYEKKAREKVDFSGDILILVGKDAIDELTLALPE